MADPIAVPKPKGVSTLVIIVLFVVLIGGGAGLWWFLKPKKTDDKTPETGTKPKDGANSRTNTQSQNVPLTAAQIQALLNRAAGLNGPAPKTPGSVENPYYIYSSEAQKMISEIAFTMQGHQETMDLIRMKYDIGKALIMGRDISCIIALKTMFIKLPMADGSIPDMNAEKYWLSFPIYGTDEPDGKAIRTELQKIVNEDYKTLNLTSIRNGNPVWWCPTLGLNLLIGTTSANTPDAHTLWIHGNQYYREPLNFYKGLNGCWVQDIQLLDDRENGQAKWPAGTMHLIAKEWVLEIDRLDKYTKWEALRVLMRPKSAGGEGIHFSFQDPNDPTKKFFSDFGIDPTKEDKEPLIKVA